MDIKRWICMILIGCMFLTVGCQKVADETKDLEDVNIQEEEEEQTVGALTEVSYPREFCCQPMKDHRRFCGMKYFTMVRALR